MQLDQPRTLRVLVRPLFGIAFLVVSAAASGQQPAQQQEEDVQVALAPGAAAPAPQPVIWNQVRIIKVKGDRVADFEARLKELGAAIARRGESFNVWQVVFGEQNTYHIVSQLESFASLPQLEANPPMEQAQWTSWLEGIMGTIDSQVMGVAEVHPDLSKLPQGPGNGERRADDPRDSELAAGQATRVRRIAARSTDTGISPILCSRRRHQRNGLRLGKRRLGVRCAGSKLGRAR